MITIWFALVVLCWVLFFVLEGFDFGVGLLAPLLGRDDHERGAAISTVGPFWDGNEVWLVAAIGVTFAAFPAWYAAELSGLYLPMVLILLMLAVRGVALEFRGKADSPAWRRGWDTALAVSSAGIVLLWGAVLAALAHGLALNADGQVTGHGLARSLHPLLSWTSAGGAVAALYAATLLGATFLSLRTTGPIRTRAQRLAVTLAGAGTVAFLLTALAIGASPLILAAAASLGVGMLSRYGREATAFTVAAAGVAATVVTVFTTHGSVILRSTLNPVWSLTMTGAAASPSALRLISVAGVIVLPGVLVYQAFSYWVFRRRVASERVSS